MMTTENYRQIQSRATEEHAANRWRLAELFENTPLPLDELVIVG